MILIGINCYSHLLLTLFESRKILHYNYSAEVYVYYFNVLNHYIEKPICETCSTFWTVVYKKIIIQKQISIMNIVSFLKHQIDLMLSIDI